MADIGHPTPALEFPDPISGLRQLSITIQRIMRGQTNNAGSVTLELSSTTTTVTDERVGANTKIALTPTNANAAAEVGNGGFYVSATTDGSFELTHASNSNTRTFNYTFGG